MYRIAVLAEQEAERQRYAEQITRFCEAKGLFPQVMQYDDQERFFETAQKEAPTNAVIALSGVAGLNAAEHLRSLCRVPDDLVQRLGFLPSRLPAAGRLFPAGAGFRGSIPARTECLD